MTQRHCTTLATVLLAYLALATTAPGAPPDEIVLAEQGDAHHDVVVVPGASQQVRQAAEDLADYLGRMSGAAFQVIEGDQTQGIVVGTADAFQDQLDLQNTFDTDPFGREDYLLRSSGDALWLVGATDLAAQHAVWDLLHRLGYRQYFPGPTWEIIPEHDRLAITVDTIERPDFHARRIWYNWGLWGYNEDAYRQWTRRNRVVQGFSLNSGHAYGGILARNQQAFEEHPEFFALVDGERRTTGGDIKFCISNEALRDLVVADAVQRVQDDPDIDSISMDPSDGGNWCECDPCTEMGSVSDRALTLANAVAEAINALDLGEKYVGMYAYNEHGPPPAIDAHPNVIISVATGFLRGGYTVEEIIEGWRARGATLGIYDYFSVIAWDWNLPGQARGGRPHDLAKRIPAFHEAGARFFDAEAGDAWGPYGLGYYAAGRMLWNVDEADRVDAIIERFLADCFGPARKPMRQFYKLLTTDEQLRSQQDRLGRMYRHLAAARELAGDADAIHTRLDDLVLYTRYAELYHAYANASADAKDAARDAVLAHSYRMRERMMVHSYGIWARLIGQDAAHADDHPLHDDRPFTDDAIAEILANGIERNEPVEIDFEAETYSDELVPAADTLELEEVSEPGAWPTVPQERQRYQLWLEEDRGELELGVTVEKVWDLKPHRIALHSPKQVHGEPVDTSDIVKPDGKRYDVTLTSPFSGLHQLEITDGSDYTRLDWPDHVRVTVESGIDSPAVTQHFRGEWSLYFYVPHGTKVIGGWASRIADWAPRISGVLRDADGQVRLDFAEIDEGFFRVDVSEQQAGRLWKFDRSQGQRLLMTVPPYLAPTARDLLLPREVVERDADR